MKYAKMMFFSRCCTANYTAGCTAFTDGIIHI